MSATVETNNDRTALPGPASAAAPERYRLGEAFVPKTRYLDQEFLKLEIERLLPRTWIVACRNEELHDVGDYVEFLVGDKSILLVKEAPTSIKAYHNACRHRGTRLAAGTGRIGDIRCPFHGWRWNLDGTIKLVLDRDEFVPRTDDDLGLEEVLVDSWGGFVFVNLDPNAGTLAEYLGVIPERWAPYQLENMRYRWVKRTIMPCNWKTGIDAFIEAYHVAGTHPQLLRLDKTNTNPSSVVEMARRSWTPTEGLGRHSRFYMDPNSGTSRYARTDDDATDERERIASRVQYNVRELRALETERDGRATLALLEMEIPEGQTAGAVFMQLRRDFALAEGVDWKDLTFEQIMAASHGWHIFPNTVIIGNQGSVLGYRAMPNGLDPDSCIFEAFNLELIPVADYGKKWGVHPTFIPDWREADLGGILEQDFANMEHVTVGMHSPSFDGHRLSRQQELTVYHHHRVADEYLWDA